MRTPRAGQPAPPPPQPWLKQQPQPGGSQTRRTWGLVEAHWLLPEFLPGVSRGAGRCPLLACGGCRAPSSLLCWGLDTPPGPSPPPLTKPSHSPPRGELHSRSWRVEGRPEHEAHGGGQRPRRPDEAHPFRVKRRRRRTLADRVCLLRTWSRARRGPEGTCWTPAEVGPRAGGLGPEPHLPRLGKLLGFLGAGAALGPPLV